MQRAGNTVGATRPAQHGRRHIGGCNDSGMTCQVRYNYSDDLDVALGTAMTESPTCATQAKNPRYSETRGSCQWKLHTHERLASVCSHESAI